MLAIGCQLPAVKLSTVYAACISIIHLKFPLESSFVLFRSSNEPELLEMHLKSSLKELAVRTCPQAGSGRKVKVGKCNIGDCESWSVRGLDSTSLGVTMVYRGVRYDQ